MTIWIIAQVNGNGIGTDDGSDLVTGGKGTAAAPWWCFTPTRCALIQPGDVTEVHDLDFTDYDFTKRYSTPTYDKTNVEIAERSRTGKKY